MENLDIQKLKLKEEREKFNQEVQQWNQMQNNYSSGLNQKIREILLQQNNKDNIQQKSSFGISQNLKSVEDQIKESNELKLEIDKLKYKYDSKFQQLKNLKNNLLKEKINFEQKSNDIKSKIKKERIDIEKIQSEINKKKDEITRKNLDLDKKEKLLYEQNEKCNRMKNLIKEKKNKNLNDEKDLEFAEYKKNIFHNELLDRNNEIENQKDFLDQKIKSLEEDKEEIFNIKNDIEELNREINLRMKCINDLNDNNAINEFNITMNKILMQEKIEQVDSVLLNKNNKTDVKDININGKEQIDTFNKFKKKSFNSELYLLKVKNKIDINKIKLSNKYNTINEKFNHEKEQEYLLKSYESLNKIKK